jgi:DNA-binding transcriptional MerR regulator
MTELEKSRDAFRTISEVAEELDLQQHVLRFWETRFNQIKPLKRGGGRRYYRPEDVDLLRGVRYLLYGQGYTIKGVQRIIKEGGIKFVQTVWREPDLPLPANILAARGEADDVGSEGAEPDVAISRTSLPGQRAGLAAQGAVLVRKPEAPVLSVADRKVIQSALSELVDAKRLLDLAGHAAARR